MKLKDIREAAGLSQNKLSELSGVNISAIRQYEQGFRDINGARVITVYKLAQALGCEVEDLLEIE